MQRQRDQIDEYLEKTRQEYSDKLSQAEQQVEKFTAVLMATEVLIQERKTISATALLKDKIDSTDNYPFGKSYDKKILFVLSLYSDITAGNIAKYIVSREPHLDEKKVFNTVSVRASLLGGKNEIVVKRRAEGNKSFYSLKE